MGFVILALILVVGFFDRAYSTKKEKEENQKKMLKQKEDANIILEEKVKERTRQLEEANNELEQSNEELTSINEELMGMNTKLEEMNVSLELSNTEMEVFSSTLSHDLGNSISRINSALRLLKQSAGEKKLNEQEILYLDSITESSTEMNSVIKGILKLFSLTNKPIKPQEVNLSLLSQKIINRYILNEGDRKIMTAIQPDMIIYADYDMIQNAMDNLISNAIKYTRKEEITHIEIGCNEMLGRNVYFIKDNGIGFDMEDTNKLFTKFSRLHRNDEYEGTGLGLVSVKRIIMKHKGDIWAESTPEKGTIFYFTIG
jgi:light-regulated signal transduction histidine kinase (bacteriophytochrome)